MSGEALFECAGDTGTGRARPEKDIDLAVAGDAGREGRVHLEALEAQSAGGDHRGHFQRVRVARGRAETDRCIGPEGKVRNARDRQQRDTGLSKWHADGDTRVDPSRAGKAGEDEVIVEVWVQARAVGHRAGHVHDAECLIVGDAAAGGVVDVVLEGRVIEHLGEDADFIATVADCAGWIGYQFESRLD